VNNFFEGQGKMVWEDGGYYEGEVCFEIYDRLPWCQSDPMFPYNPDSGHRAKLTDMGRKCEETGQYGTKVCGEMAIPCEIERCTSPGNNLQHSCTHEDCGQIHLLRLENACNSSLEEGTSTFYYGF